MNKKTIFIICGFVLAIILTAVITTLIVKNNDNNKTNEVTKKESSTKSKEDPTEINNEEINIKENNIKNSNKDKNNESSTTVKDQSKNNKEETEENNTTTLPENNVSNNKTENDVITYVEEISLEESGNKIKNGFVTVIDFIFYDGEIYGKTFKELSASAKIKIISLAIKIDSKIDEYFPGYKETISSTTNKVYTSVKTKLITLYLDTTVKICNDNPTLCEDAKQGLSDLKQSFGITWDFIKEISGIGITKLKDWYEVWKEE